MGGALTASLDYAGLTIPVIGAGVGVADTGLRPTFIVVGAVLAVFDLAALTYLRARSWRA